MAKGNQRIELLFEGDRGAARLDEFARKLGVDYPAPPTSPVDYAQPAHRKEVVVQETHSFLELPMKELEEIRTAARERMNDLEQEANEIQQMFETRIAAIKAKYERLRKGIDYSMDAFKVLREQCIALEDSSKEPDAK